ncbi:MAG TPA: YidC/Oxa1 family membrane protein insertase [Bacilli bacterium]|nr:MAG: Membrane protein insertase MisCB precursor [Tenericutes bacterium ADurb.BinA124]HNZ49980.1 YidC/Oxa1 family membrane protein insertase [Bacilli bacterium]HOH17791.1 YidC/Oxa1 family membrane protein insertase [Bacilli bacterium]HPX84272.1 YidC/Oxa1 family membrane protein insertase [Bacilli bacterium]HQC74013.1 YidC/Oxa1 family membrane protein insertase [Bacilli bacterium]
MKTNYKKYLFVALVIIGLFILSSCGGKPTEYKPIDGVKGIGDILVWPMAALMWLIGKSVAFGYYGIVILVATIIVRTLAWPIYAKTNDMTLKMQLMAPEQAKIEQKYAGKTDPESNQRKQMELMQLYKKYGVGIGGCLIQFIQLPIFISFYQTLQRVPKTVGAEYTFDFSFLNTNFFGINLFATRSESTYQMWGIIILAILVGGTQIVSQIIATRRQKKAKAESQSNIPAYRQPAQTDIQKQTETTMKIMMYGMTAMMMVFVYNSTAALGFYWLVGNLYSTLQGYFGHKSSQKRMARLKAKM